DLHAQLVQLFDHAARAVEAAGAEAVQLGAERGVVGVEAVAEQVDLALAVERGVLDGGDQLDADPFRLRGGLGHAVHGVVVGERDGGEAVLGGAPHHRGGRVGPVRRGGVEVKVRGGLHAGAQSAPACAVARAASIRMRATSGRENSGGGSSPAASMARTLVPLRKTCSSLPCGQVLAVAMLPHVRQKKECSNLSGVMPSSSGLKRSNMRWAS